MRENVLIHGVCSLIGDFLGIVPALLELSKTYNIYIDTISEIDGLVELLHPNPIQRIKDDTTIDKHLYINMQAIAIKSNDVGWYMTQAFSDALGLAVPTIPAKASLSFPIIPTKSYDFVLSPFGRSLPEDQKWQRHNWQQLISRHPDKKFALLGSSNHLYNNNRNFLHGDNLDVIFDLKFPELCNLFKNCGLLISVVTGTSHLAFHLGVKNILLVSQNGNWGKNPDAFCIMKHVPSITVEDVESFITFVPPFYDFDEQYYLEKNPDLIGHWALSGYSHFWQHGRHEDRLHRWKCTKSI